MKLYLITVKTAEPIPDETYNPLNMGYNILSSITMFATDEKMIHHVSEGNHVRIDTLFCEEFSLDELRILETSLQRIIKNETELKAINS